MSGRLQFVKWLAALSFGATLVTPCLAEQHPRANWQQNRPPKQQAEKQHQQAHQQQRQEKQAHNNANRPPRANSDSHAGDFNRPENGKTRSGNPNRPPFAQRPATPQERQRNEQQFNRLAPQQKQEMRERAQAWQRLSPEQRAHIKNDIAPKWQQLPPDRQRAIRSRLNVLKNMPESARNQHLNDPNFTRGMHEEDKAMLRDLSHMHVGGAPEAPPNEQ
jgi:uncharacterized protein DUF3106